MVFSVVPLKFNNNNNKNHHHLNNMAEPYRTGQTWRERVPQGTKLGVILFTVLTNKLLSHWHLRIKFADDTSAIEIIPRSSISLLNSVVSDIHIFSIDPAKCKEMLIDFMHRPNFTLSPIVVGNNIIKRVSSYKILGVFIASDLKWNNHIDYRCKKACKKLHSLMVLRRDGVEQGNSLKVYLNTVSPVLEWCSPSLTINSKLFIQ